MPVPTSVKDIDLSPPPGRTYFSTDREWREEFTYFLMVDRFHDDTDRRPVHQAGRSAGVRTPDDFYGGKLRGITRNLDYIAGLGCTALWLSPVLENNVGAYHGYNISSYLDVDPRFGTKQDLVDLVDAAHRRDPPMRVILDVVINHSGDNWAYHPGEGIYAGGRRYEMAGMRRTDRPVPIELRDPRFYHRMGAISSPGGFDTPPKCLQGDIVTLKDYWNDDDADGSELVNILIQVHSYWIREADVDGFRVDAVKHMGALACSRFASNIREYAYLLGKRGFFLFGEVASASDELLDRYIGPNTSVQDPGGTVFFGLDSALDFRLAFSLRGVLKGFDDPRALFDRLEAQRQRALNRGELGRYLVTFADNHDSFWQPGGRIANGAPDAQVVGIVGYLLCALGMPVLYYGTEQGFSGSGGDVQMREAMFDRDRPGVNLLNPHCAIYRGIAEIAAVARASEPLRFGRMYFRQIADKSLQFGFPFGTEYTLAFSRILYPQEVLVAYNVSGAARSDRVVVDASLHRPGDRMRFLSGAAGDVGVERAPDGTVYVRLDLAPHQFVVLQ
ncbi:MAG TPA: alpha-amylase family glycosyl hydrolase [Crenalkalicoccus sp.]|nr:alpha-amylase family glycosyl hydrolase [Crenalkalicoccus sp.]